MRRERNAATGSRCLGQGGVAARRRLDQCQCAVGDHGHRRQGVLLDQCRCRGSPRLGKRARAGRSRRARDSRRHRCDDRADRRAQARRRRRPPPRAASPCASHSHGVQPVVGASAAARRGVADVEAGGDPGRCRRHRGGLGQGRRRQVDHRAQSGAGPARSRPARRPARCRHLRPVGAAADRHSREAATERRPEDDSDSSASALPSCRSAFWSRKTPR